jgi:hypothetical protein
MHIFGNKCVEILSNMLAEMVIWPITINISERPCMSENTGVCEFTVYVCTVQYDIPVWVCYFQQHLGVAMGENRHGIHRAQRWYDATDRARGYSLVSRIIGLSHTPPHPGSSVSGRAFASGAVG